MNRLLQEHRRVIQKHFGKGFDSLWAIGYYCGSAGHVSQEAVKRYVKENNVPINPLYAQMDRTGCMFCTGFKNWKQVMAKYKPAHLKLILKKKEGQDVLHECYTENEVTERASSQD